MQTFTQIRLDGISRSETGCCLNMTVVKGTDREQLAAAISEETAAAIEAVLREEPFSPIKPGIYRYEVQEMTEGPELPKTLTLQISKGRARTKRSLVVENDLFLTVWNIMHFQELPSKISPLRTT